ncbi:MAG: hypothetical protein LBB98_07215, partial [Treponema sp.]|nr:hypothetical protein [Treponema sp.]
GCVPPHTQRFHGEIFDTPPLCGGEVHFCRIKSYLSTCEKHDISSADALKMLFEGQMPGFMLEKL